MAADTLSAIVIGAMAIALVAAWRLGYQRREAGRVRRLHLWRLDHD